jgi:spore coat polysaccharide biosynthesis protein SpsF
MIDHIVDVALSSDVDKVAIVTPDEELADTITAVPVHVWYGKRDVLGEFYNALDGHKGAVVRLTADCPMLNKETINKVLSAYNSSPFGAYYYNHHDQDDDQVNSQDGYDVEVFSADMLRRACAKAHSSGDREHVTTYIKNNWASIKVETDNPWGCSVDKFTDLHLVNMLMEDRAGSDCQSCLK